METLEIPPEGSTPSQTLETAQEQNPSSTASGLSVPEQIETRSDPGSGIQDDGVRVSGDEAASAHDNKVDESSTGIEGRAARSEVPIGGVGDGGVGVSVEETAVVDEKNGGVRGDVDVGSSLAGGDLVMGDRAALESKVCVAESVPVPDEDQKVEIPGTDGDSSAIEGVPMEKGGENGVGSGEGAVTGIRENENGGVDEVLVGPSEEDGAPRSNGGCVGMEIDLMGGVQENGSRVVGGVSAEAGHSSSENEVMETGGSSVLEEGKEGLLNESSFSGAAQVTAADVCLPENGQDKVGEAQASVPDIEENKAAEVVEAPVSFLDEKQSALGDAADAGIAVVVPEMVAFEGEEVAAGGNEGMEKGGISMSEEGKESSLNESGFPAVTQAIAVDVGLPENRQDPRSKVVGGHSVPEIEKTKEAVVEAPVSAVDEKQNTVGDAADAVIRVSDEKQQTAPETVAVEGGEVAAEGSELMEKGDSSMSEEGKGSSLNESVSSVVAQSLTPDVCLLENGLESRTEVAEAHISAPEIEKAEVTEVIEAPISLVVVAEKQDTVGDASEVGITVLHEKQQIVPELVAGEGGAVAAEGNGFQEDGVLGHTNPSAGTEVTESISTEVIVMDVCLPENGQNQGAEAVEMHVEADVSLLDEKQKSVGNAMDAGTALSEQKQQTGPESVAREGEQVVAEENEIHEDVVTCHKNLSAVIEDTKSQEFEVVETHALVLETMKIQEAEVVEAPLSLPNENQNDACDGKDAGTAFSDEKQQTVSKLVAGEGEEVAADRHQFPEDGLPCSESPSAGIEVGKLNSAQVIDMDVCLPENGQNPESEVLEMHVEEPSSCLGEKQNTVRDAADAGIALPDEQQQMVTESVAGEGEQVAAEGNVSEVVIPGHDDLSAGIEVTKPASAQDMAKDVCLSENGPDQGDEVAGTQNLVPEMEKIVVAEAVEASISPLDEKQSTVGNAANASTALFDEKQCTGPESVGGEGEEVAADGNQFLKDGFPGEGSPSTTIEAMEADVSLLENAVDDATDASIALSDENEQILPESVAGEGEEAAAEGDQSAEDCALDHNNPGAIVEVTEPLSMSGAEEKEVDDEDEEDEDEADDVEGQFSVGDFVWGKIRSHPWWPGQIYDPSDASDFARKYRRRDRLLVAYFGDGTFAWCYPSQLRPFNRYFERMMKQSNTKSFLNAVEEAVGEVSRCVESEMTCSCTLEEIQVRLTRPMAVNAGIQEGKTIPQGHVDGLSIGEFDPANFIARLKDIASVVSVRDALELTVLKSRLSAFYGAKGYGELPMYHLPRGIMDLEDNAKSQLSDRNDFDGQLIYLTQTPHEEDSLSSPVGPGAGKSGQSLSQKRPQISEDKIYQRKKRSVAELMAGNLDSELEYDGTVKDEGAVSGKPAVSSKDQKKTRLSAAPPAAEEEDSDVEKDVAEEGKGIGKSASSSRKRKKAKHLVSSPSSMAENKASDENDDAGVEEGKATGKSSSSSKKRKNTRHSASSPSATAENKASDVENDDSVDEEGKTIDKSALSSRTRKKTKHLVSSPPASPNNKVTFDVEIDDVEAEEGAVLSSPRNRRRSKYLSAPYAMLSGHKSIVSLDDAEAGNVKVPIVSRVGASISRIAVQLTGGPPILKCSGETPQKKISEEPNVEDKTPGTSGPRTAKRNRKTHAPKDDDATADEMLSDIRSAAVDPIHSRVFLCMGGQGFFTLEWNQQTSLEVLRRHVRNLLAVQVVERENPQLRNTNHQEKILAGPTHPILNLERRRAKRRSKQIRRLLNVSLNGLVWRIQPRILQHFSSHSNPV
ncbi:uncharacterized protein LOC131237825 isoform X2 [Magnolia sinica]|uniref:uncharacterized protein LOC131237825 isoform X2 n=1 Tax=Magnolia sinica TaxID=86752 RepID=UPI00265928DE|nr:uncharacterized protein LOC131237825 isoform X2 [Magnolia sinica]